MLNKLNKIKKISNFQKDKDSTIFIELLEINDNLGFLSDEINELKETFKPVDISEIKKRLDATEEIIVELEII